MTYKKPVSNLINIEEELLREQTEHHQGEEEILSQLGVEEYGFYRRLRKLAKSRWDIAQSVADQLAAEVIYEWAKSGTQRHDMGRILTELDIIVEEILERKKQK